ncbi:MAG: hypothetical protein GAK38_00994 [Xylophilus sp.]|nr:MAG: hypothetical protein GAK38_00994 [Xylophilus sp.]
MTLSPSSMSSRRRLLLALAASSLLLAARAQAQGDWPQKTTTIVVPFPAGGSTDTVGRVLANQLQAATGQSFIVDNRPGATGAIGAAYVKRAPADGSVLMVASLGIFVIAPHLQKNLAYDALKDFDYISIPVQAPNVLVAAPAKKARTVADVIAELQAQPGKVSFASSGNGASDHLSAEVFWQQSKTQGLHVPYKGGAPAITDLLGNQVDYSFPNVNAVLDHIRAGKLRAIAVTGTARSPVLPDVPTLAESGVQGAEVYSWQGLVGPRGLPAAVKEQIAAAAITAMRGPRCASA